MQLSNLVQQRDFRIVIIDLFMIVILMVNLAYIIAEFNYENPHVNNFLATYLPDYHAWYGQVLHKNFLLYDAIFVGVFLTEFMLRWVAAIYLKVHERWYYYPFIHWYDILGCIPLGAFRSLRFLRIVGIIIRLQKLKAINIRKWLVYQLFNRYMGVLVEEVSDRVVVNVISGVKKELNSGGVTTDRIIKTVILPQREVLIDWLSQRVQQATARTHHQMEDELRTYLAEKVRIATEKNKEIDNFKYLPVAGSIVQNMLESAISDITFNVINGIVLDIAHGKNSKIIEEVSNIAIDTIVQDNHNRQGLDDTINEMVQAILDIVIEQVEIKQWQQQQ